MMPVDPKCFQRYKYYILSSCSYDSVAKLYM